MFSFNDFFIKVKWREVKLLKWSEKRFYVCEGCLMLIVHISILMLLMPIEQRWSLIIRWATCYLLIDKQKNLKDKLIYTVHVIKIRYWHKINN